MKWSFGQNNRGQKCVFHVFLLHSVVMFCSDWNCLIFCCLLLRKRDLQRVKDTCHETLPFFFFFKMCSWCYLRKCIASTKFQKGGSKLILHISIPLNWWRHIMTCNQKCQILFILKFVLLLQAFSKPAYFHGFHF